MASRSHLQKPTTTESSAIAPSNGLKSRPFSPPQTATSTTPDLQAQLEHAQRFGHKVEKIQFGTHRPTPTILQPKLTIGAPGDQYEQEADRVAQQVVQRLHAPKLERPQSGETVQRETMPEDEELQMKPLVDQIQRVELPDDELQMKPDTLQRETDPEEDDELQMKPMLQMKDGGTVAASDDLESAIQHSRGRGQPLSDSIRQPLEHAFGGVDFRGVNVHTDAHSDQLNRSIQAKAFTTGQDIFFRQGTYQPGSSSGQELLAHELTHVVQQNGGAVKRKVSKVDAGAPVLQREWVENDGIYMWNKLIDGVTWFAKGPEEVWFNITDASQIEQGQEEDYQQYQGQKKSLEEWQALRLGASDVSDVLVEAPPQSKSRSKAVVESTLTPEQIKAIQQAREVPNVLKFNFAGSGEEAWKTHKKKYAKPDKEQMGSAEHESGGKKYSKEEHTIDKEKLVFEYAGPLGKFMGKAGLVDSGENSTQANLADAQKEFTAYMNKYCAAKDQVPEIKPVQINIKGFSRGAATASVFANWVKSSSFKDVVDVNLVLIDPVHGTGKVAKGLMPSEQDVSGIYDEENAPDKSGTTYLMPIKSGHSSDYFTPQKISGYQRLIIGYGPGIKHSFGLGESEDSTLKYNGQPVKGMKLSTLPKGLFVVNAADMNIVKVPNMKVWKEKYDKLVLGKANKKEKRDVVIQEALVALSQYFEE